MRMAMNFAFLNPSVKIITLKKLVSLVIVFCSALGFAQHWQSDYAEALSLAAERELPLVLVFSGSDWCAPCIKLDQWIWQSDEFKAYAHENYILYRADFPRKKSNRLSEEQVVQNRELAERFNSKGHFPLVVLLNGGEEVLGTTGFKKMAPLEYIAHLNTFLR